MTDFFQIAGPVLAACLVLRYLWGQATRENLPVFCAILGLSFASCCTWLFARCYRSEHFKASVTDNLLNAYTASSLPAFRTSLVAANNNLSTLRDGNTAVLHPGPATDVGQVKAVIRQALEDSVDGVYDPFLQETYLQRGRRALASLIKVTPADRSYLAPKVEVVLPDGISVYPHNREYAAWIALSSFWFVLSAFFGAASYLDKTKRQQAGGPDLRVYQEARQREAQFYQQAVKQVS